MTSHVDLDAIRLDRGGHDTRDQGVCLLETISWFAGEEHTDHPPCVSPVLGTFGRSWNDALDDQTRQRLIPFIPRMVGTASDGADEARAWILTDWLARVCAPAFLRTAGLTEQAQQLEGALPITGSESAALLQGALDLAAAAASAAGAATGVAAWAAAGAAAGAAARAAARAAAGAAARGAAWAAAGVAARAAAGAAAGDAASA